MRKIWICVTLILLLSMPALAGGNLTARMDGNVLRVEWSGVPSGGSVLTIYENDWPVCVENVNGCEGSESIVIDGRGGRYSARLQTPDGCLTAKVEGEKPTTVERPKPIETPDPTAAPTPVPVQTSEAPTKEPTEVSNEEPKEVSTETPLETPDGTSTLKPTEVANEATLTPAPVTSKPTEVANVTPRPTSRGGKNRTDLASQVVALVNEERAKQGLSTLRVSDELTRAACVRAGEIVQTFSHTRPNGASWSTVSGAAYGENIAKGQNSAEKVIASWMTSQGHRENILHGSYGSIGVCARVENGVVYWVQLFGK